MLNKKAPAADKAEAFRPLLNMLSDVLITSDELCKHWRLTPTHVCNLRKLKKGAPFIKLPSGGIRYRVSEILAAELRGRGGPLTVDCVCLVLADCDGSEDDDTDDRDAGEAGDELKISAALMRTVSESLTVATAAALERQPDTALRAAIAVLMSTGPAMPIKLTAGGWPENSLPRKAGSHFHSVFPALAGTPLNELLGQFAVLVAHAVDVRNFSGGPPNKDDDALIAAIDGATFTLEARKAFNAADYFLRASKAVALAAIEEIREAGMASGLAPEDVLADMKKSELADAAADAARAAGWLPPELRHPSYEIGAVKIAIAAE